jgi:putative ABC transport system substrate-binding protein
MQKTRDSIIAGLGASVLLAASLTTAQAMEIGVAWLGKSGMASSVRAGFEEGMKELLPDANLEVRPDLADADTLQKAINDYETSKTAMVILRSNGAKILGKHGPKIPSFIGGANHPGQLGVISNLEAPEGNITGVTYYLDYLVRMESFMAVVPNVTKVHMLVEEGHAGSQVDIDGTLEACKTLNLTCTHSVVKGRDQALADLAGHKDASMIIIGNQAGLYDKNMGAFLAEMGSVPVVSYAAGAVKLGALTSLAADDHQLGRLLALKVVEVVSGGKSVHDVPVGYDEDPTLLVNMATLSSLNLELEPEILEGAQLIE